MVFEGATNDANDWTISVGDAAAASSIAFEAAGGLLMGAGVANVDPTTASFWAASSNGFVFEGATANGFETSIVITDPTADVTWTVGAAGQLTNVVTGQESGWEVLNAANAVCTATCTGSLALAGIDTATGNFVAPDDATADSCLCAG